MNVFALQKLLKVAEKVPADLIPIISDGMIVHRSWINYLEVKFVGAFYMRDANIQTSIHLLGARLVVRGRLDYFRIQARCDSADFFPNSSYASKQYESMGHSLRFSVTYVTYRLSRC